MSDDANTPPERPEFDRLIFDLRALVKRQGTVAKAEERRRAVSAVMAKAAALTARHLAAKRDAKARAAPGPQTDGRADPPRPPTRPRLVMPRGYTISG